MIAQDIMLHFIFIIIFHFTMQEIILEPEKNIMW